MTNGHWMKNFYRFLALTAVAPSAFAASVGGFEIQGYGFLKASSMYADKGLASYNNINLSAPTNAVAQTRSQDKVGRMSFQAAQSRFGTTISKDKIMTRFEFDFIDFNKSSPTTQMVPRVRIASLTYTWGEGNKIIVGQDWDLFSPVTTYTFDYVGLYFLAGNSGFMRQQAQYLKTIGDWEFGAAVGMAGNNPGVTDNDLELGKSPTYSARIIRNLEKGRVGVSAIYSTLHYNLENKPSRDSYGYNAFYERSYGAFAVKSEAYYGQNLANIGALTIGRGTSTTNVREFGGTLTGIYGLNQQDYIFGGAGLARVDNKGPISPFALGNGTNAPVNTIASAGIRSNFLSRVGHERRITPDFSWISEFSRYETDSKLTASNYQNNIAYSVETGIQLRF